MAKNKFSLLKYLSNLAGIDLYDTAIWRYCHLAVFTIFLIIVLPIIIFVEFIVAFLSGIADTIGIWCDEKHKTFDEED